MYKTRRTETRIKTICGYHCNELSKHNLLQQWSTQINIPLILETNHNNIIVYAKNITRYCKEQSPKIQEVQEQDTTAADISKAPTAILSKGLDNCI